jgi:hypothetical protein
MAKINWRQRFTAVAVHLALTLLITGAAALLIFLLWFPDGLASVTGGMELFLLVVGCDAALGPLVSLFIYDPTKGRTKLLVDYCIIGALQVLALAYGLFAVAESRPAVIAYDRNALDIVAAIQLEPDDLLKASAREYRSIPITGPKLVSVERPTDQKELSDLVFLMIAGIGPATKPTYYRPYDAARDAIRNRSGAMELLLNGSGDQEAVIRRGITATDKVESQLRWIGVRHRFGTAVALLDAETLQPLHYIPVDPSWVKREKPQE